MIIVGVFTLTSQSAEVFLPGWKRWSFGVVVLIYSVIRIFRLKKKNA
jgi:hypothetical protein